VHFRDIPFLRLTVPLLAGVITAEYLPHLLLIALSAGIFSLVIMTIRLQHRGFHPDMVFGILLLTFLFSSGYMLRRAECGKLSDLGGNRQEYILRLADYPDKSNSGCSVRAKIAGVVSGDSVTCPRGSVMLWLISDTIPPAWRPGDYLSVRIKPLRIEDNGNPCGFNYSRHMEGLGIRYMAFARAGDITGYGPGRHRTIRESSLIAARAVTDTFRRSGLAGEELGLVMALTIGDREYLDRETLTAFSRSGTMHVMAVSGLHVGILSVVLSWLLFFIRGRHRPLRALIIIPALWGFAFITGLSPSVLRATIMFTFLQAGTLLRRPAAGMNTLLASAFIITAVHPGVIFEAGFQLSYLAVGFILAFFHPLRRLITLKNRAAGYIWQMTAVSLAAQAGTFALSVRLFNIFPLLFPFTNIVIIPVSFLVILLAILLIITSPFPPVASIFALLLDHLAHFALGFTGFISSMEHGVINNIGMSALETVLLTVAAALLLSLLLHRPRMTLRPVLIAVILLLLCNTFKAAQESKRDRLINYNIRGESLVVRQHGRLLFVPLREGNVPAEIKKHSCTRGLKIRLIEPG
jgi:competence protein ComEC